MQENSNIFSTHSDYLTLGFL